MGVTKRFYLLMGIVVILFVGLLVLSFFSYNMYNESQYTKKTLISEKLMIVSELKKTKRNLEMAIADNTAYKEDLIIEQEKVSVLLNEIGKTNIDLATILKYKREIKRLNYVVTDLNKQNEILVKSNLAYKSQRDSTILILGNAQRYRDSLLAVNEDLNINAIRGRGVKISVVDLKIKPMRQTQGENIILTDKANKTNKIRVGFTVVGNKVSNACMKKYYIQIIDAENKVIGEGKYKLFGSSILYYSGVVEVKYQNRSLDVYQDLSEAQFVKGTYFANIFDNDELVSKTTFYLR